MAVNEGMGGAVDGQAAESLRINVNTSEVLRLAMATAPWRLLPDPDGGVLRKPVIMEEAVMTKDEIAQLVKLARDLPKRYPAIVDDAGKPAPADIEFGFVQGKLALFQLRPFLESGAARQNVYLAQMDREMEVHLSGTVNLDEKVGGRP